LNDKEDEEEEEEGDINSIDPMVVDRLMAQSLAQFNSEYNVIDNTTTTNSNNSNSKKVVPKSTANATTNINTTVHTHAPTIVSTSLLEVSCIVLTSAFMKHQGLGNICDLITKEGCTVSNCMCMLCMYM